MPNLMKNSYKNAQKIRKMNLKLFYSEHVSSMLWFLDVKNSVLKDGLEDITLMMEI